MSFPICCKTFEQTHEPDEAWHAFESQRAHCRMMRKMSIQSQIVEVLAAPSPEHLWRLRGELLLANIAPDSSVWHLLDGFHGFLVELSASLSAQEYSKLATLFDIGAVGGVALESVLQSNLSGREIFKRFLIGGASEALMVVASRQYVKASEVETAAVCESAAWRLHKDIWSLSQEFQPDLAQASRLSATNKLLAPILDNSVDYSAKALLICYLFLVLLLARLKPLMSGAPQE
jgi:hypothetical protein